MGEASCLSCRSRKVRCDRALPQCSKCKQRGLQCLSPVAPPRMLWLQPKTSGASIDQDDAEVDMHARRQLLFERGQQAQDSADLLSLVSGASIGSILDHLDQQADLIKGNEVIGSGPFRAFRHEEILPLPISPPRSTPAHGLLGLEWWPFVPNTLTELDNDNVMQLAWTPDPGLCIPEEPAAQAREPQTVDQCPPETVGSPPELLATGPPLTFSPPRVSLPDLEDFTMSTVRQLLDHYQNSMVNLFTPARVESKSPWEILYVPNVLSTLGEIGLTGNSSNAKVALLFAVLAISAFSLDILHTPGQISVGQDWNTLGNIYRERAIRRLQSSLRNLSAAHHKTEKYKNILMPLLSMVTISVVSGEMKNAAHYLRDIEQIITLYGIPKARKSRKVKMLHCIYLYLRVLTEGTIVHDRTSITGRSSSELDQSPYVKLSTWDTLLRESSNTHDILNIDFMQSLTSKSTFEQIYSVPESLFRLILETTQLAGEVEGLNVEGLNANHRLSSIEHDSLSVRVKMLEDTICEWEYQNYGDVSLLNSTDARKETFPYHLVRAIYSALIIYFYRCVRDVNATTLQPYVQQTIYHLLEHDKQKEMYKDSSSDICWPGFIAGCEATRPRSRQQISEWLERSAKSSGMRMFAVARQAVQKVWDARSIPGHQNLSWSRILGEFSDLRVLVLT